MTSSEFQTLLTNATNIAFDFAKNYVVDDLPNDFKYTVQLNVSRDDINLNQFDIYPNDNDKVVDFIAADKVVNVLNRKGKVPVWIDISVEFVHKNCTVFRLLCAGRYSDNENEFYYLKNATGPFGVKSPAFPIDYVEGKKFKLKSKHKNSFIQWLTKS